MIDKQFFEYARHCTELPQNIETHAERPADSMRVSTQHLALVANRTMSNGIGNLYRDNLYFVEAIITNGAEVKAQVNGVPGEWKLDSFMVPM